MRIFEYIFYSIYRNTSITNKLNPVSSSIGALNLLILFNVATGLIRLKNYFTFELTKAVFIVVIAIPSMIILYYFYANNRAEKVISKFKNKKTQLLFRVDLLVLLYACLSIYSFGNVLGIGIEYSLVLIVFVILTSLYSYLHVIRFDKKK
ncbi:hypothetical protein [Seonamhaeicola maritimus]|uniref:Uncharacterized protein n=1 Tax=Seonamhaeicola maritimus TaxID=2591822 RepID=A0A5C7GKL6_9FLAO|nr:hypothetical protein [Seonamhaeicola maritimus]TXG38888.1 hypothetical protein FUA22_03080 [Seonamhaeicola maritimus]